MMPRAWRDGGYISARYMYLGLGMLGENMSSRHLIPLLLILRWNLGWLFNF